MAECQARLDGLRVALRIEEELALPDDPFRPAQPVQEVEYPRYLLGRVGGPRLLPVAEGGVR